MNRLRKKEQKKKHREKSVKERLQKRREYDRMMRKLEKEAQDLIEKTEKDLDLMDE